jgi:hypothetical protein
MHSPIHRVHPGRIEPPRLLLRMPSIASQAAKARYSVSGNGKAWALRPKVLRRRPGMYQACRALQSSGSNAAPTQKNKTRSQEPKDSYRTTILHAVGRLRHSWAAVRVVAPDSGLHVTRTGGEQVAHGRRCHGDNCRVC